MSAVFLQSKGNSELLQDLQRQLITNGSLLVDDATQATANIKITKEEKQSIIWG